MQEDPGGRTPVRQAGEQAFRNAVLRQRLRGGARRRVKAGTETVHDRDRHQFGDIAPSLPAVKAPQVVGAHDPDESDAGTPINQP